MAQIFAQSMTWKSKRNRWTRNEIGLLKELIKKHDCNPKDLSNVRLESSCFFPKLAEITNSLNQQLTIQIPVDHGGQYKLQYNVYTLKTLWK